MDDDREWSLSKFVGESNIGRVFETKNSRLKVQRHFDIVEIGGSRNLRRLNKKCKFCALGRLILFLTTH